MNIHDAVFRFLAALIGQYAEKHTKKFLWTGDDVCSPSSDDSMNRVQRFYEHAVDLEEKRLTKSRYAQIEFEVMKRFLERYLPPSGYILDIGCSTGAYLIYLAEKGYRVSGIDLSRPAIERARAKLKRRGLDRNVAHLAQGNAVDLSMFAPGTFDAVLSFGPFYHTLDLLSREHMLSEIARVLKPGGLLFASFLSRFAPVIQGMALYPSFFSESSFSETLRTGIRYARGSRYHTDIYTAHPEEVKSFMVQGGFHPRCLAAVEGLSAWRVWAIERGFRDEEEFRHLIDVLVSIAEEPCLLGATIQTLCISESRKDR